MADLFGCQGSGATRNSWSNSPASALSGQQKEHDGVATVTSCRARARQSKQAAPAPATTTATGTGVRSRRPHLRSASQRRHPAVRYGQPPSGSTDQRCI